MTKFGIIGLVAVVMAITGVIIQVAYDDRGFYLVIVGLLLSIVRQVTKAKNRKI